MSKIVTFHSFRRGTGRTSLLTSIAVILARQGKRVGIVDANLQSPSAHILFKLRDSDIHQTLDSYLWGECTLDQIIYDVSKVASLEDDTLYLIPSSDDMLRVIRTLKEGFSINSLTSVFSKFANLRNLDYLFVDSSSGLNEDILLSMSVADLLVIVMRLDEQDYQGVGMTLEIAKRLNLPRSLVVVNNAPPGYDPFMVEKQIRQSFDCEVGAILPFSEDFLALASEDIFELRYPEHPLSKMLEELAAKI